MSVGFRKHSSSLTIVQVVSVIIAGVLSCWLALAYLGIVGPIHPDSPDISAPVMLGRVLEHAFFGFVLFAGTLTSGLALLSLLPTAWALTPFDRKFLALPVGLMFWLILCFVGRVADVSSWPILLVAYGLSAIRFGKIIQSLELSSQSHSAPARKTSWGATILVLAFGTILSASFGLIWHLPTTFAIGTLDLGDLGSYVAHYHTLKAGVYPIFSLSVEGERYGFYFNQISSFLAFAFDSLPGFEITLFLTTTVVFFFFLGVCYGLHQLLQYRRHLGKAELEPVWSCAIALAICAATRYPSWIVESPPYAFAVTILFPIVYLAARGKERIGFFYLLAPLVVVAFAISKVVMVSILGAYVLCCFGSTATRIRSKPALTLLVVGAAVVAAFSIGMLVSFGPKFLSFASANDLGPPSLNYLYQKIFIQGGKWPKALYKSLPSLAIDIGFLLLIVCTVRLRDFSLLIAVIVGVLLYYAYPFLFNATAASAFALIAAWLMLAPDDVLRRREKTARWVNAAAILALFSHFRQDPGGWEFTLIWLTCLGGGLAVLLRNGTEAQLEAPASAWRKIGEKWTYVLPAALLLVMVSEANGTLRIGGDKRLVVPPKLYDLWIKIRELTPKDALIFTDQTGDDPGRLTGWNDLSNTTERQFFISSWSMSRLRADTTARQERLTLNSEVLQGRQAPAQLLLSRHYGSYYAAVSADHAIPGNAERIYENGDYAIYRLSE